MASLTKQTHDAAQIRRRADPSTRQGEARHHPGKEGVRMVVEPSSAKMIALDWV